MRSRSDICSIPMLARGARCRCRGLSGYQRPSAIRCALCHTSPHRTRWGQAQPGGRVEPTEQATVKTGAATGVLTRRMLGGVVLGVLAFGLVYRLTLMVRDDMTIAIAAGAAAALAIGSLALWRTVAPLVSKQAELQARYEAALADALTDPLTGLGNHRAFHEELDRQVAAALRYNVPLSLLLVDIDDFKSINDTRGHANGDRVLRGFGSLLNGALRACGSRLPRRRRRVRGPLPAHRSRRRPRRLAAPADPGPGADRLARGGRVRSPSPAVCRHCPSSASARRSSTRRPMRRCMRPSAADARRSCCTSRRWRWPTPPAPPCRRWPR